MTKCCSQCFNDKILTAYINKDYEEIGSCPSCQSTNTKLVYAENFIDYFEMLLELYEESDEKNSINLFQLMQQDWEIFSNENISENLLPKILSYSVGKKYIHKNINDTSIKEIWNNFKEEIKHNNRFFPKSDDLNIEDLRAWTNELKNETYRKKILFRARISDDRKIIPISEMGKPPKSIISTGRANPVGISYLYMATDSKTAISEVRPHIGDYITIAKIEIAKKLNLADLRNPKKSISPFSRPEESAEKLFKYISLLQHLGEELSKPILPREAPFEYLPSQYLSELIKDAGFDGIIYKSSVGKGDNIVLFNDENIKFKEVELLKIENLSFSSSKIE